MKTTSPKEKHIKSITSKKPAKQAATEAKLEKFIKKNAKVLAAIEPILNEAASLYASILKTCPTKSATKLQDNLVKRLKISLFQEYAIDNDAIPTKFHMTFNARSKNVHIPANKTNTDTNC